jgi:molybdopterin converting factor small subunit
MPHVTFYAAARAAAGVSRAEIDGSTLSALVKNLEHSYPALGPVLPGCSYLLNGVACKDLDSALTSADNVDILPRFAGG